MILRLQRPCSDFVVWSHVAFLVAIVTNVRRNFHEGNLFIVPAVILSVLYHRYHERNRKLARVEMMFVTNLYIYGVAQLYFVHHPLLFFTELVCAFSVLLFFCISSYARLSPKQYDRWHPWTMHIVPAFWAFLVSSLHGSILSLPYFSTIPNDMFVFSFAIENDYWHWEYS